MKESGCLGRIDGCKKMEIAGMGLVSLAGCCLVFFLIEPYAAHGSILQLGGPCESFVTVHGYPCQEFQVKTEDGYVLGVQRIPEGRVSGSGKNREPVLLQHGVLTDGMTWLLDAPDQSLGFVLADRGFDVWISNTRGTRWSRTHTSLDPIDPTINLFGSWDVTTTSDNYSHEGYRLIGCSSKYQMVAMSHELVGRVYGKAFWAWSWDELVEHDLPAVFDFVYSKTGQKLHYVGHSMGTLIALASFSQGKLVDKLKSAALLSPVAYLSHMTTSIGQLAAKAFVGEITIWLGLAEFNPKGEVVINFLTALCAYPGIDCFDLMTSFTGKNCCLNASTVDLFLRYEPQSTSTKTIVHLSQMVRYGIISKFNYGNDEQNMRYYGESMPPAYNMSNIPNDLPLFLSYGGQDALSDVGDVQLLLDNLKFHEGDKLTVQFIKDFAHADFVMGVSAKRIVYDALIAFFHRQQ